MLPWRPLTSLGGQLWGLAMTPRQERGHFGSVMMLRLFWVVIALLMTQPAWPDEPRPLKGVALVVGNGDYEHLTKLANSANDARAVEGLLDRLGFDVTAGTDRDAKRLTRDLDGLVQDADGADVAILYYGGHAVE